MTCLCRATRKLHTHVLNMTGIDPRLDQRMFAVFMLASSVNIAQTLMNGGTVAVESLDQRWVQRFARANRPLERAVKITDDIAAFIALFPVPNGGSLLDDNQEALFFVVIIDKQMLWEVEKVGPYRTRDEAKTVLRDIQKNIQDTNRSKHLTAIISELPVMQEASEQAVVND